MHANGTEHSPTDGEAHHGCRWRGLRTAADGVHPVGQVVESIGEQSGSSNMTKRRAACEVSIPMLLSESVHNRVGVARSGPALRR